MAPVSEKSPQATDGVLKIAVLSHLLWLEVSNYFILLNFVRISTLNTKSLNSRPTHYILNKYRADVSLMKLTFLHVTNEHKCNLYVMCPYVYMWKKKNWNGKKKNGDTGWV